MPFLIDFISCVWEEDFEEIKKEKHQTVIKYTCIVGQPPTVR